MLSFKYKKPVTFINLTFILILQKLSLYQSIEKWIERIGVAWFQSHTWPKREILRLNSRIASRKLRWRPGVCLLQNINMHSRLGGGISVPMRWSKGKKTVSCCISCIKPSILSELLANMIFSDFRGLYVAERKSIKHDEDDLNLFTTCWILG